MILYFIYSNCESDRKGILISCIDLISYGDEKNNALNKKFMNFPRLYLFCPLINMFTKIDHDHFDYDHK